MLAVTSLGLVASHPACQRLAPVRLPSHGLAGSSARGTAAPPYSRGCWFCAGTGVWVGAGGRRGYLQRVESNPSPIND